MCLAGCQSELGKMQISGWYSRATQMESQGTRPETLPWHGSLLPLPLPGFLCTLVCEEYRTSLPSPSEWLTTEEIMPVIRDQTAWGLMPVTSEGLWQVTSSLWSLSFSICELGGQ